MSKLKPCPFCGGAPVSDEDGVDSHGCANCANGARAAADVWNHRPIEDVLVAERDRAMELLERALKVLLILHDGDIPASGPNDALTKDAISAILRDAEIPWT
jgi:hypothetical protein